tara:strand:+ start:64 stop:960 length:897 start_codon:yes stop_codon:yes gene_type:complete
MKNISIGYFADGEWGLNAFKKIIKDKSILIKFVCLRYKNPHKKILQIAKKNKIEILVLKNLNSTRSINKILKYKSNFLVSMSYDQIFGKKLNNSFKDAIINCHAGNLPFYRGRNILNWALINDEKKFGITVHFIDKKIDTGDIILKKIFQIKDNDTYASLLKICYRECPKLLYCAIKMIQKNELKPITQKSIHPKGSYFKKRKIGDEIINWHHSSRKIFNFTRAICKPGPMAKTLYKKKFFYINKVKDLKDLKSYKDSKAGTIVNIVNGKPIIKTGNGFVKLIKWFGKNKISVNSKFI